MLVGSISVHINALGESVHNAPRGGVASFAEPLQGAPFENVNDRL
jgi:3-hydroxy acid dehydrogenase/malonic semialdehyde reductase